MSWKSLLLRTTPRSKIFFPRFKSFHPCLWIFYAINWFYFLVCLMTVCFPIEWIQFNSIFLRLTICYHHSGFSGLINSFMVTDYTNRFILFPIKLGIQLNDFWFHLLNKIEILSAFKPCFRFQILPESCSSSSSSTFFFSTFASVLFKLLSLQTRLRMECERDNNGSNSGVAIFSRQDSILFTSDQNLLEKQLSSNETWFKINYLIIWLNIN